MRNEIIAQSARFRALRTSRDRVRIKRADSKVEVGSLKRCRQFGGWEFVAEPEYRCQDLVTFAEAATRAVLRLEAA
jgi:hypothetical protein